MDGALLAFAGFGGDARISSAIASNIWAAYEKHGQNSFRENRLKFIILQCDSGTIIISQVSLLDGWISKS
jgi:hypothetical protein